MKLPMLFPCLLLAASGALAAGPTTLHVRVTERGDKGTVDIAVPIGLAHAALAAGLEGKAGDASAPLSLGGQDVEIARLRELWAEVRKSPGTDLLRIDEGDEQVRIGLKNGRVRVDVVESDSRTVRIDVPQEVVDALLSGDGDRLDVAAAVAKLREMDAGEIVRVDDGEDQVRIWLE